MATLNVWAACALLALGSCGLGGGGAELQVNSFPQSGLGVFRLLTEEDAPDLNVPYVVFVPGMDVSDPMALPWPSQDKGPGLRIYMSAARRGQMASYLAMVEVPTLFTPQEDLIEVLRADQPWEGAALRKPVVLHDVEGLGRSILVYQGADGSLGLAVSTDGQLFEKRQGTLVSAAQIGSIGSFGAVVVGGVLRLYLLLDEVRVVMLEIPTKDLLLPVRPTMRPLSIGAKGFQVPLSSTETVPAERLRGLSVRRQSTLGQRERYDLFVVAEGPGPKESARFSVNAASSYDGVEFLALPRPILGRFSGIPQGPTVTTVSQRGFLLLGLRGSPTAQSGIAAGLIP